MYENAVVTAKKILKTSVSLRSAESEYIVVSEARKTMVWLR